LIDFFGDDLEGLVGLAQEGLHLVPLTRRGYCMRIIRVAVAKHSQRVDGLGTLVAGASETVISTDAPSLS
jgi:hypothetical protein